MSDLSHLSDEELEAIANAPAPKGVAEMSDEELAALASTPSKPETGPLDDLKKLGSFSADAISGALGQVLKPLTVPLAEMDKVTGAPMRAGAGAFQSGAPMADVGHAIADQFMAGLPSVENGMVSGGQILPTTPTGADIAEKGMVASGIKPEFAQTMAPLGGMVVDVGLDPTMLIPGKSVTKTAELVKDGASAIARPVGRALAKAEMSAAKAISRTGQVMTQGVLKADRALQMYKELSSWEMLMPGTKDFGAMSKQAQRVGEFRKALRETPITVPGSHDVAQQVKSTVEEAMYRSGRTPGGERLLQMIQDRAFEKQVIQDAPQVSVVDDGFGNMNEHVVPSQFREVVTPRDLTLDELDDLVREADDLGFTPIGNPRSQPAKWGPTITQTRKMMDDAMQTVPAGQMFKDEKQHFAGLATAGSKRSKLVEIGSTLAAVGAGVVTLNPAAVLLTAMKPSTYVNLLATLKLPGEVARGLQASYASGKLGIMRDTIAHLAEKSPALAERLVRATALVASKPVGRQDLTADEASSLDLVRSFDPEQVAAERARLASDTSLNSIERAKGMSQLNERGYVVLPPVLAPAPQEPESDKVFGGKQGLDKLVQSLRSH